MSLVYAAARTGALVALLVVLALAGCAPGNPTPAGAAYAPKSDGDLRDDGGGGDGGGSM